MTSVTAEASGQFMIDGTLGVNRLGYGTMQLTGPGVWGPPADPDGAVRVLRRAAELGVNLFDTADAYGPMVAEPLLHRALAPYDENIVIATKAGFTRQGPDKWTPVGRPAYLRQQCEMSLRILGVDRIALLQLHRVDPEVPLEEQVGELKALKDEGKIAHIGLSEVTVDQIEKARAIAPIASVQNRYNLTDRAAEDVLDYCESRQIAFIPWFPLATGGLAKPGGPLEAIASRLSATPSQLALAWLLRRSPVLLPIPGTSSVKHLEQNVAAAGVQLTDDDVAGLTAAVTP
ncbi:aldo/keto reductase [Planotetraspora kaengkrachanensis]|uniref:Oxidoreductase n=1 Tax=Planotetraspora kaengkrachanensis TaxID=575193 RepID=A0A8J3PRQ1_9ACTN|nr:aldo/keto reductase [Planotetraspora kaengkrachanensis]GIG78649.1 oxidoreductase [Planotetraspora kaengkrachanensis]